METERRHVVTAFLRDGGRILIVHRSTSVGSFQGYWSGISGYLEGDPLIHVLREIGEETGLRPDEVSLVCQPEPVDIPDRHHPFLWCLHPFLFDVHAPERIHLDWENDDLRWILPEELEQYPTVPALRMALDLCLCTSTSSIP
jgi:8-oxo-dGTP diphosphatase